MRYNTNKTMQLIGKQYITKIFTAKENEAIQDIFNAHREETDLYSIALDAFIAGHITGKQTERAKKHSAQRGG